MLTLISFINNELRIKDPNAEIKTRAAINGFIHTVHYNFERYEFIVEFDPDSGYYDTSHLIKLIRNKLNLLTK